MSNEAKESLIRYYILMRQAGGMGHTVSATPRQLESLIRISEALCKMRLGLEVME
jgi:DNA replication licensing factor MCM4